MFVSLANTQTGLRLFH